MSCSKPLPSFTFDVLRYLNRDQLERFSIVCRPLKNIIDRYFYSKPHRVFDELLIREYTGVYALEHNKVRWHPNRDDYSVQQFLAAQKCNADDLTFYSFAEMRQYLGPTVRIMDVTIFVAAGSNKNPQHIVEMESIAYLWRDHKIEIFPHNSIYCRIIAEDFQSILSSPTILQCRELYMLNAQFSFKDFKVLYFVQFLELIYFDEEVEVDPSYLIEFLEHPGVKPIVGLQNARHEDMVNALECLKKTFSSAVVPNAFKIVFQYDDESFDNDENLLIPFRETNKTSNEIMELKKGFPTEFQAENIVENFDEEFCYTLERFSI